MRVRYSWRHGRRVWRLELSCVVRYGLVRLGCSSRPPSVSRRGREQKTGLPEVVHVFVRRQGSSSRAVHQARKTRQGTCLKTAKKSGPGTPPTSFFLPMRALWRPLASCPWTSAPIHRNRWTYASAFADCLTRSLLELGRFLPLGVKHPLDLKHRDGVALEKSGQVRLVEQFHRI